MKIYKYSGMGMGNTLISNGSVSKNVQVQGDSTIIAHNPEDESLIEGSQQFAKGIIRVATAQEITGVDAEAVLIEQQKTIQAYMPFMDSDMMNKLKNIPAEGLESIKRRILEVLNFYERNPDGSGQPGFKSINEVYNDAGIDTKDELTGDYLTDNGEQNGSGTDKLPEYDEITVVQLRELLNSKQIDFNEKALKPELYDLAKQIFV